MFLAQGNHVLYNQRQDLLINLAMRQAFHVMQLPVLELAEWLRLEIENNPILEIDLAKETFKESLEESRPESGVFRNKAQELMEKKRKDAQENHLMGSVSLYEHLMQQVPLYFEERNEIHLAELIIGHLNEKGFLDQPLQEVAPSIPLHQLELVLKKVQSLDPPGIAARDVREALLLQLDIQGNSSSLAREIIAHHFTLLLHNQLPSLAQTLQISMAALNAIIEEEIRPLDLYPGYRFHFSLMASIIPDVFLCQIEGKWHIEINKALLPKFHVAQIYQQPLFEPHSEESSYVRQKMASGKWLKRAVQKRNQTLRRIVEFLLKAQAPFFEEEGRGSLLALTTAQAAQELGLHESTVARAVSNKFLACPQGLFSLRSFFKQGVSVASGGRMSSQTLKELLLKAVELEDKKEPLSDEELCNQFKKKGIECARRTISKYRAALQIAPSAQRRKWV